MALVACRECGAQVSTEAPTCPKCGAKSPKPKTTSRLSIFFAGAVLLIVGKCIFDQQGSEGRLVERHAAQATADAAKTPEQRAAEERARRDAETSRAKEEQQLQVAVAFVKTLKANMKNPSSFELTSAVRTAEGTLCVEYRGTNSFNAIVPNYAVLPSSGKPAAGGERDVAAAWNKHCASKSGIDMRHIRQAL